MPSHKRVLTLLARGGYAARGTVYLIVGFFAVLAAFGPGDSEGTEGALRTLLDQPFGTFLVWAMVVGLIGYAVWRGVQGLSDADHHGSDARGLVIRAALLVSGLTYLALALYALSLLGVFGAGGGQGGGGFAQAAAGAVGNRVVSLALCLVFAGVALAHWIKAGKRRYAKYFDAPPRSMPLVHTVSITGLAARGFVFAVLSVLLFYRGINAGGNGAQPPGLEEALNFVQGLPFGALLLALLGLGLIAFAVYSFIEARWRRIHMKVPG